MPVYIQLLITKLMTYIWQQSWDILRWMEMNWEKYLRDRPATQATVYSSYSENFVNYQENICGGVLL